MPGVELDLRDVGPEVRRAAAVVALALVARDLLDAFTHQGHEETLARAPVAEDTERERAVELGRGDELGHRADRRLEIETILGRPPRRRVGMVAGDEQARSGLARRLGRGLGVALETAAERVPGFALLVRALFGEARHELPQHVGPVDAGLLEDPPGACRGTGRRRFGQQGDDDVSRCDELIVAGQARGGLKHLPEVARDMVRPRGRGAVR